MSAFSDLPSSFTRLHEGTEEEVDFDGTSGGGVAARASWYGPWSDRKAFLTVVGGLPETISYPGGASVTRIVPLVYPAFPRCYAYRARVEGKGASRLPAAGADDESIEYDWAFISVEFKTFAYGLDGAFPLITEQLDGGADMVTRPGTAYKFPSDNLVVNQPVGVPVPTIDFTLTFHRLPSLNKLLWASLVGRVSSAPFYGFDAGYVHYIGLGTTTTVDTAGTFSYDASHRFRYRYVPHNAIMRPDGAGFEAPVQIGDTSKLILPTADLNLLFA